MDIEVREQKLIKDICGKVKDLLHILKDLERLDKKEHREKLFKKLEKEEVKEINELVKAFLETSIILEDLFKYFDLLILEIRQTADPRFSSRLEAALIKNTDAIRRRIERIINRLERYGIELARR